MVIKSLYLYIISLICRHRIINQKERQIYQDETHATHNLTIQELTRSVFMKVFVLPEPSNSYQQIPRAIDLGH